MDCCAAPDGEAPTVPAPLQSQASRLDGGATVLQSDGALVTLSVERPALTTLLRAAPPHGYRSTDLPTLNAVFLI
jgi:hypothetical protein